MTTFLDLLPTIVAWGALFGWAYTAWAFRRAVRRERHAYELTAEAHLRAFALALEVRTLRKRLGLPDSDGKLYFTEEPDATEPAPEAESGGGGGGGGAHHG